MSPLALPRYSEPAAFIVRVRIQLVLLPSWSPYVFDYMLFQAFVELALLEILYTSIVPNVRLLPKRSQGLDKSFIFALSM